MSGMVGEPVNAQAGSCRKDKLTVLPERPRCRTACRRHARSAECLRVGPDILGVRWHDQDRTRGKGSE